MQLRRIAAHSYVICVLGFVMMTALSGCTMHHEYGPYRGKVVDADTNEPIEGAVVFVRFFTKSSTMPGGPMSRYAGAAEALTDANGEFLIPVQGLELFRFGNKWDPDGRFLVYKPGYGSYPFRKGTQSNDRSDCTGTFPSNSPVNIKLSKLLTIEERQRELMYAYYCTVYVLEKDRYQVFSIIEAERKRLGLGSLPVPEGGSE